MTDGLSASLDAQRRLWETAAEFVEKTDVSAERAETLLSAEVGHTDSDVVFRENKLELHHYEPEKRKHETPILVVYALVNRPYILDLQPDRSVIRRLLEAGFDVYLIDWGEPSILDRSLTMEDYVGRYLDNCVEFVCESRGVEDLHLLGYCMGGSMSIMYTALYQEYVRTLSLLATPLAFDGCGGILERWASHYDPDVAVDALGNLPAELLAVEFSMMDPIDQYITKYVRLYENFEDEEFVANFARMEQWIWDGVDLAGEAYREFINDIYQDNQLIDGEYHLGDRRVAIEDIEVPALQVVGEYDHIVPPESSKPFHDRVGSDDETLIEFPRGHIGISVSGKAHEELWPEVCAWFAERDAGLDADGTAETDQRDSAETVAVDTEGTAVAQATVETVEKVAEAAAAAGAGSTSTEQVSVQTVEGIGPTYAERLTGAGIETTADLAAHDPEELADIADAPTGRAENWLERVGS